MTIDFKAIEFDTPDEAIQHANAKHAEFGGNGVAIQHGGKPLLIGREDAQRLEEAGIAFAYLIDHAMPDGSHRIVTVPVNDD